MTTINRRALIQLVSGTVVASAVSQTDVFADGPGPNDREFESEFTGSVIELVDRSMYFMETMYRIEEETNYTAEHVPIGGDPGVLSVTFVQSSLSSQEYMSIVQEPYKLGNFEEVASEIQDDGWWFAAAHGGAVNGLVSSVYAEYQVGAFPNADLLVIYSGRPEEFVDGLPRMQEGVLIGDYEPFIMLEQGNPTALMFPAVTAKPTQPSTQPTGNSRSSSGRGDRSRAGNTTSDRSSRGNQNQSTTGSDYPDAVLAHRTEFMGTFNEFVEAISVVIDEVSTEADVSGAFTIIDGLAETWLGYPARANRLSAPAEYDSLEGLYLTWADEIATLGSSYLGLYDGTSNVDRMFDQIDVVDQADRALKAELDSLASYIDTHSAA